MKVAKKLISRWKQPGYDPSTHSTTTALCGLEMVYNDLNCSDVQSDLYWSSLKELVTLIIVIRRFDNGGYFVVNSKESKLILKSSLNRFDIVYDSLSKALNPYPYHSEDLKNLNKWILILKRNFKYAL